MGRGVIYLSKNVIEDFKSTPISFLKTPLGFDAFPLFIINYMNSWRGIFP